MFVVMALSRAFYISEREARSSDATVVVVVELENFIFENSDECAIKNHDGRTTSVYGHFRSGTEILYFLILSYFRCNVTAHSAFILFHFVVVDHQN